MESISLVSKTYGLIGPVGCVLIGLSLVSAYISIRNTYYLHLVGKDFYKKFADIEKLDKGEIRRLYHNSDNPLLQIISEVVRFHSQHSQDIRAEVAYMFHRNFEGVGSGLSYLRLISVVSPLLGLMGTMLGMVSVFKIVAAATSVDTTLFAQGIWEALITTIMGLCVAVPTLFFYYHLSLKMKGFRIEAVEHSYRTVELFHKECPYGRALAQGRDANESAQAASRKSAGDPARDRG